jgi:hypothetical protein
MADISNRAGDTSSRLGARGRMDLYLAPGSSLSLRASLPKAPSFQRPSRLTRLQLQPHQVPNHLPGRDPRHSPQGREVQRAREPVGKAKEEHGRDPTPCVLERKAVLRHLVLLDGPATEVMDAAGGVHLGLEPARGKGPLDAGKYVEVVICRVAARVALGSQRRTEDDEILGDAYSGSSKISAGSDLGVFVPAAAMTAQACAVACAKQE